MLSINSICISTLVVYEIGSSRGGSCSADGISTPGRSQSNSIQFNSAHLMVTASKFFHSLGKKSSSMANHLARLLYLREASDWYSLRLPRDHPRSHEARFTCNLRCVRCLSLRPRPLGRLRDHENLVLPRLQHDPIVPWPTKATTNDPVSGSASDEPLQVAF